MNFLFCICFQRTHMFRYRFTDLVFDGHYDVAVRGRHRNPYLEAAAKWTTLVTPSCLDVHAGNMSICGKCDSVCSASVVGTCVSIFKYPRNHLADPYDPEGLNYTAILLPDAVHIRLTISWTQPPLQPHHYVVHVADDQNHSYKTNVSGEASSTDFAGAPLQLHGHIMLFVYAFNANGERKAGAAIEIELESVYRQAAVQNRGSAPFRGGGASGGGDAAASAVHGFPHALYNLAYVVVLAGTLAVCLLLLVGLLWQRRRRVKSLANTDVSFFLFYQQNYSD